MASSCPHGFPKPTNCVECMEDGNLPPVPQVPAPHVETAPFVAQYDGPCSECSFPIHGGRQLIARMSDGSYRHWSCIKEETS